MNAESKHALIGLAALVGFVILVSLVHERGKADGVAELVNTGIVVIVTEDDVYHCVRDTPQEDDTISYSIDLYSCLEQTMKANLKAYAESQ